MAIESGWCEVAADVLELTAAGDALAPFRPRPVAHDPFPSLVQFGEVVGRFTERHDTADLRAAQTQLSRIHPPTDD